MTFVKKRHNFMFTLTKPAVYLFNGFYLHCKQKSRYRIKKNEACLIISNHQTDFDAPILAQAVNKNIYYVATDSIFSKKFVSSFLSWAYSPIPKKKGFADPLCLKNMLRALKEKGCVGLFVEGNRSYAEFQYFIDPGIVRLIKASNATLLLHKITGGTGVRPRWGSNIRKGKFYGEITRILKPEEYKEMDDQTLLNIICENIKSYDSETGYLYKSKARAESLEKMLFVCPCCNKSQTLVSNKHIIKCNNCNLEVEYTENLHLKSNNTSFKFDILNDWYQFQKQWVKNYNVVSGNIIFEDPKVDLFLSRVKKKRILLASGKITLTDKTLTINDYSIDLSKIIIASPVSGHKISFTTEDGEYLIKGKEKFNPLKYVFMFNKLDTHMKLKSIDKYYSLD